MFDGLFNSDSFHSETISSNFKIPFRYLHLEIIQTLQRMGNIRQSSVDSVNYPPNSWRYFQSLIQIQRRSSLPKTLELNYSDLNRLTNLLKEEKLHHVVEFTCLTVIPLNQGIANSQKKDFYSNLSYFSVKNDYQKLQILFLTQLQLNNCEFCSFINAPFLKNLTLSNNHLRDISCLRKLNFQCLKSLYLHRNHLTNSSFERFQLNDSKFKSLQLDHISGQKVTNMEDASCLFKSNLRYFYGIIMEKKTNRRTLNIMLQKRFVSENGLKIEITEKD